MGAATRKNLNHLHSKQTLRAWHSLVLPDYSTTTSIHVKGKAKEPACSDEFSCFRERAEYGFEGTVLEERTH